jgi:DNA-directed RNA polymerase specialized sigma24 family protein
MGGWDSFATFDMVNGSLSHFGYDMGVDDAVQTGLVSLLDALPAFRRDCSIHRYANRIAARTALLNRARSRTLRLEWRHPGPPAERCHSARESDGSRYAGCR